MRSYVLNQAVSANSRRSMSSATKDVKVDWSRFYWNSSPEKIAKTNQFRAWVATSEALFAKFQKPPVAVDFAKAKSSVRDQELVANLEAFYKSQQPPADTYEMPASEKQESDEDIAFLTEVEAYNAESIPILKEEIDFLTKNRTTRDTTLLDMQMAYPLIHEQIEDELERREWFKNTEFDKSTASA